MLAHQGGDTSALSCWSHNVATIAYVCTQARLIGLDEVGAKDSPFRVASYEGFCRYFYPSVSDLRLRTLRRERIGVARANGRLQNRPNLRPVRLAVLTNLEHGSTQIRRP